MLRYTQTGLGREVGRVAATGGGCKAMQRGNMCYSNLEARQFRQVEKLSYAASRRGGSPVLEDTMHNGTREWGICFGGVTTGDDASEG